MGDDFNEDTPPTHPQRTVQLLALVSFREDVQRFVDALAAGEVSKMLFVDFSAGVERLYRAYYDRTGALRDVTPADPDKTPVDFTRSLEWHLHGGTRVRPLPQAYAELEWDVEFEVDDSDVVDVEDE